jgi:hypothetical protein
LALADYVVDPADVEATCKAIGDWYASETGETTDVSYAGMILAAVLPAHDRALILALADRLESGGDPCKDRCFSNTVDWLRGEAKALGADE